MFSRKILRLELSARPGQTEEQLQAAIDLVDELTWDAKEKFAKIGYGAILVETKQTLWQKLLRKWS